MQKSAGGSCGCPVRAPLFLSLLVLLTITASTAVANGWRDHPIVQCLTRLLAPNYRKVSSYRSRQSVVWDTAHTYRFHGNASLGLEPFDLTATYVPAEGRSNPSTRMSYVSETGVVFRKGTLGRTSTDLGAFHQLLRWDESAIRRLMDPNELRAVGLVVDVAAGQGELVEKLRSLGAEGTEGVDLVLEPWQLTRAHYKHGSAWSLPYEAPQVAILYETWGPTWFRECKMEGRKPWSTVDVLTEYHRVLKPGGLVRLGPVPLEKLKQYLQHVPGLKLRYVAKTNYGNRVYVEIQKE